MPRLSPPVPAFPVPALRVPALRPAAALALALAAAGCTAPGADRGPLAALLAPLAGNDPARMQQRGALEVQVKTRLDAILTGIATGGGPELTRAFDIAGVPPGDRAARIVQLEGDRGLYEANPGALVSALMLYGRAPG
ncbi:MAG: hypothetical protein IT542_05690 [Rubellimicrobium sp.]|nr:hypothetical protein [Rubellimicrobium sp.]